MNQSVTEGQAFKRWALLSVSDKTDIVPFAEALAKLGFGILSTGGTAKVLAETKIPVTEVSKHTGFPEMLDGRVKTLHPKIHAGILFVRGNPEHEAVVAEHGIDPIDIVVGNLYPFEGAIKTKPDDLLHAIENIDIGGPTLIRAAAKNHAGAGEGDGVAVVIDPKDYQAVITELEHHGKVTLETRRRLARKVFERTAFYDAAIAPHLSHLFRPEVEKGEGKGFFAQLRMIAMELVQVCRYGENPHQRGAFYCVETNDPLALSKFELLSGKEMSSNNLRDLDGALRALANCHVSLKAEMGHGVLIAVGVKHTNPCGAAFGSNGASVMRNMVEGDLTAIFGGIVITNFVIGEQEAKALLHHKSDERRFLEVIAAPEFTDEAVKLLTKAKNLRLLVNPELIDPTLDETLVATPVRGGFLVQEPNTRVVTTKDFKYVSVLEPTEEQKMQMVFARALLASSKSNNVLAVNNNMLVANGTGQMDRLRCCEIMAMRARELLEGAVIASDAFFPFRDSVDKLAEYKVGAILSVEGSVRDAEVIAAANERGIPLVFTEFRQFLH